MIEGNHLVHHPHLFGFLGGILAAKEPDFTSFLLAHVAGEIRGTESPVETTDFRSCLSETGVLGSDREVAHDMKHVASTDGVSVYHGDDGFRERTDGLVQVEHVEARHAVFINVASYSFHFLVASGTKCFIPGSREYNNANVTPFPADIYGIQHFEIGLRAESVINFLAVNGYFSYSFEEFKSNVFIFFDYSPFSF